MFGFFQYFLLVKQCNKMDSCVQCVIFFSFTDGEWKAKTVYHNQKEEETESHACWRFDLVLQAVGVGPFLP